ncbi:serine/threonine-protein kinase [Naasia sp. SYSU D00948]|uniref:serine/threonine-protein kinase n=1 Tax=Naasia sp. SYSU D00948 TaxID=2817379 RepID=UPI001B30D67E|nr:serine/threonine-protein kinase [Naasia sp. SYSU D00948]
MTSTRPDTGAILGGRYQVGELLGSGGMATVHRAHDLVLDRDVAVKVFRTDVREASDTRRVQAEIQMLGSVNHPNLVTLHDASFSGDSGTAFLVMELVDGEDLGHLLAERRISPREALQIGAQIASALAHIHRKGIVHRDVKPANILVRRDQDGRVVAKLADLGIARLADATHLTSAGQMLGTVAYLAPEQITGGYADSASDVYALGLVLIECLTGAKPFAGTPQESAATRTVRPPELPPGLPEISSAILRAMTALDPGSRISAAQAEDALTRWEAMSGTAAIPLQSLPLRTAGTPSGPVPAPGAPPAETDGITQPLATPHDGLTRPLATPYPALTEPAAIAGPAPATPYPGLAPATPLPQHAPAAGTGGLPAWQPATAPTTTPTRIRKDRRGRAVAIVMWALVAAVLLAGVLLAPAVIQSLSGDAGQSAPAYPDVPGELGDVLRDLQESVE